MDKIRKLREIIKNESIKHEKIESFQRMVETLFDIVYQKPDDTTDDKTNTVFISVDRKLYDKKSKDKRILESITDFLDAMLVGRKPSFSRDSRYIVRIAPEGINNEVKYSIDKELGELNILQYHNIEHDYDGAIVTIERIRESYVIRVENTLLVKPVLSIMSKILNKHYFYAVQNEGVSVLLTAIENLDRIVSSLQTLSMKYQEKLIIKYYSKLEEFLWRLDSFSVVEGRGDLQKASEPFYEMIVRDIEKYHAESVSFIKPVLTGLLNTHNKETNERNSDILWHLNRLQERKNL